jgi:hypothetical protein
MRVKRLGIALLLAIVSATFIVPLAQADTAPDAPSITQKRPLGSDFLDITFRNPATYGAVITSYDVWMSDNAGLSYASNFSAPAPVDPTALVYLRIPSSSAVTRLVKVRVNTAAGAGAWSTPVQMFTTGARPMRVYVQAPDGTPIAGGSITWTMPSTPTGGTARSSVTYGLTSDGYIDLPSAPAGEATFTLTNGELPNGVLVSGQMGAILGYKSTQLQIVRPPAALRVVSVVMPNGLPISDVSVDVNSTDMTDTQTRQGFTFTLPDSGLLSATPDNGPAVEPSPSETATPDPTASEEPDTYDYGSDVVDEANYDEEYWDYEEYDYFWVDWYFWMRKPLGLLSRLINHSDSGQRAVVTEGDVVASGKTNAMGRFVIKGFTNTVPTATVSYDDGVISQSQTIQLQAPLTTVELPYAPFVSAGTAAVDATADRPALIPVAVTDVSNQGPLRNSVLARQYATSVIRQKAKFKIVPPKGAPKGKCKGVASTYTTSSTTGKVNAKVCATISGNYLVKSLTPGVRSLGAVQVKVRGGAPSAVRQFKGVSKKPGVLFLSWKAPQYLGGTTVKQYKVVLSYPGRKSITKITSKPMLTVTGLLHARGYKVSVTALTKYGSSKAVSIRCPIV